MTIIEYGPKRPHGAGFVGLRIFVKKVGDKPFQEYLSFNGCSARQIALLRRQAVQIDEREKEDARQRLEAHRLYQASRSPLSGVRGVSICVVQRPRRSPEFVINVAGAPRSQSRSGSLAKFTPSGSLLDYPWIEKHWRLACRTLANHKGFKRTPSRGYQLQPSPDAVMRYLGQTVPGLEFDLQRL